MSSNNANVSEVLCILPGLQMPGEFRLYREVPAWEVPALNRMRAHGFFRKCRQSTADLIAHTFSGSLKAAVLREMSLPENTPAFLLAPVVQQMEMHSAQMAQLPLSWTQAHRIAGRINGFLAADGWQIHVFRPNLWLTVYPENLDWYAEPLWNLGAQVDAHSKIRGPDADKMLKIMTEIQMLLHMPILGDETENPRPVAVNGVWFWQDLTGKAAKNAAAWGAGDWLPEENRLSLQAMDAAFLQEIAGKPGQKILYFPDAHTAAGQMDITAHQAFLAEFDRKILTFFLEKTLSGSLKKLSVLSQNGCLNITPHSPRAFWRRGGVYRGDWL